MERNEKIQSIVREIEGVKFKMMNDKKRQEVYKILMMPIQCTSYSNGKLITNMSNSVIETTQTYWPQYINKDNNQAFRYDFKPDCDMSDFACGFYDKVYEDILGETKLVDDDGNLTNKNFAGDTMTSVSKLPKLQEKYHCLANFWLLPMDIGRTSKNKWCKVSQDNNVEDFMDRFLLLLKNNFKTYKDMYKKYFKNIETFEQFAEIHFLKGSYVDEKYVIREYSDILDRTTTDTLYR